MPLKQRRRLSRKKGEGEGKTSQGIARPSAIALGTIPPKGSSFPTVARVHHGMPIRDEAECRSTTLHNGKPAAGAPGSIVRQRAAIRDCMQRRYEVRTGGTWARCSAEAAVTALAKMHGDLSAPAIHRALESVDGVRGATAWYRYGD